jgi:hypothetical protein
MNGITIKQAVQQSGLSENYIRKAIAKGDLIVEKETVGDTRIPRNVIVNFEAWRAEAKAHSKREDGRNKFVLYATADELQRLQDLLEDDAFVLPIMRANTKKEEAAE